MLEFHIPGGKILEIEHLVLDYNGTIATDGKLIPKVGDFLHRLKDKVQVHVLTADTFGSAAQNLQGINCQLSVMPPGRQDTGKLRYVKKLGARKTVCIGNGRNDLLMIKKAALGIVVILEEGACSATVMTADIVCKSVVDALQLLLEPGRLVATLRNG